MKRAMVDCRVERSWWLAGWLAPAGLTAFPSLSLSSLPLSPPWHVHDTGGSGSRREKEEEGKEAEVVEARAEVKEEEEEARGRELY